MTIDGSAIKAIDELSVASNARMVFLDDIQYSTTPLWRPNDPTGPQVLAISTLTGLVDWWGAEPDTFGDIGLDDKAGLLVVVSGANQVCVYGPPRGRSNQRFLYVRATAADLAEPFLGKFHSQDEFIIGLMTRFISADDDRAMLAKWIGTLTDEKATTLVDDGVTQRVTVRTGISGLAGVNLQNIVRLTPRRTFPEVGGISEPMLVRVAQGAKAALFAADSGAWHLESTASIAAWLREKMPDAKILA